MFVRYTSFLLFFVWTPLCFGCGEKTVPTNQETPRQAMQKSMEAVRTNDYAAFEECYDTTKVPSGLLETVFAFGHKLHLAKTRIVQQFGKDGWDTFANPSPSGTRPVGHVEVTFSTGSLDDQSLNDADFEIEGDSASFYDPISKQDVHLNRKNDIWRIEFPPGDYKWLEQFFGWSIVALDTALEHVGDKDMTPKDLKNIASAAFVKPQKK